MRVNFTWHFMKSNPVAGGPLSRCVARKPKVVPLSSNLRGVGDESTLLWAGLSRSRSGYVVRLSVIRFPIPEELTADQVTAGHGVGMKTAP